jgi:hypothetical protein
MGGGNIDTMSILPQATGNMINKYTFSQNTSLQQFSYVKYNFTLIIVLENDVIPHKVTC